MRRFYSRTVSKLTKLLERLFWARKLAGHFHSNDRSVFSWKAFPESEFPESLALVRLVREFSSWSWFFMYQWFTSLKEVWLCFRNRVQFELHLHDIKTLATSASVDLILLLCNRKIKWVYFGPKTVLFYWNLIMVTLAVSVQFESHLWQVILCQLMK